MRSWAVPKEPPEKEQYFLQEIPVVKGNSGTQEIADKTTQALIDHKGAIVFGHGTFSIGEHLMKLISLKN